MVWRQLGRIVNIDACGSYCLELTIYSVSANRATNVFPLRRARLRRPKSTPCTLQIIRSVTPFICNSCGWLKCQTMLSCSTFAFVFFLLTHKISSLSFLQPRVRLVPLSENTVSSFPRLATKQEMAHKKDWVSREYFILRCTAEK